MYYSNGASLSLSPSIPPSLLTGDRMDGYQKKKYVSKLIFIFLLGNDIDFGHQEAVNLLSSVHFSEKQIVSRGLGLAGREGETNYSETSKYGRLYMGLTIVSLLERVSLFSLKY